MHEWNETCKRDRPRCSGSTPHAVSRRQGAAGPATAARDRARSQGLPNDSLARGLEGDPALRVRSGPGSHGSQAHAGARSGRRAEGLLYEWPRSEKEPTKFWLSNLPADTSLKKLVRLAKLRWRVERDYQEMKNEVGLDHLEGRSWLGWHHHVSLCCAAHAFLALSRAPGLL